MKPPKTTNVLDNHGGFTAITKSPTYVRIIMGSKGEREALASDYKDDRLQSQFVRWEKVGRECNTLWRPGQLLRKTTIGTLAEFNEDSFFQRNNKVTKAVYKVPGYCNRTALWFDNATGKRIA